MSNYEVIADIAKIAELNKRLECQLKKTFKHPESIIAPEPTQTLCDIYFERVDGENVRAWGKFTKLNRLTNLFLSGNPGEKKSIKIIVELNFPESTYNRRVAGVFVKDSKGGIYLAHRGNLTMGGGLKNKHDGPKKKKGGLSKNDVLREFSSWIIKAEDGLRDPTRLILIGDLNDINIADRLFDFANETRKVVTKIRARTESV